MVTLEDIKAFKKELRNLNEYLYELDELNESIEKYDRVLYEPKTIHYENSNGGCPIDKNEITKKRDKKKEIRNVLQRTVNSICLTVSAIEDDRERKLITDVFIEHKRKEAMARDLGMDRTTLYRWTNKIIRKALEVRMHKKK